MGKHFYLRNYARMIVDICIIVAAAVKIIDSYVTLCLSYNDL